MSKTSFKAFCIEFYTNHTGKTGPEIYKEFERSGLLKELEDDYEDIHGMGMEALMQMFDEHLGEEEKSEMPKCEHHQVRTLIIPEVARLIAERFGISESEALDRFYKSATAQNLADEENGLYGQSALFIFGQYLEEMEMRS
jgi:hypothetical protein